MKHLFISLFFAAFLSGCACNSPCGTSRCGSSSSSVCSSCSDLGYTYDYKVCPVPGAAELPPSSGEGYHPSVAENQTPAPVFLIQVPPPTVIYQQSREEVTSVTTTNVGEANPYKGSYVIPPRVVVVPQQTIIHEGAGAAVPVTPTPAPAAVSPGYTYPYQPYGYTFVDTGTNAITNIVTNMPPTNMVTNIGNPLTNQGPFTPVITNITGTNAGTSIQNPLTPPTTPQSATGLQRPTKTQATTGSGTGIPAQSVRGGAYAPPPPNAPPK